jgi:glyoxylase-like metal-dependent hydrolase (beta-lactamase superfamily II)
MHLNTCVVRTLTISLCLLSIGPVVSVRAQETPMEVQKLRPNLFLLTGGNTTNANTVVFVMSNGVAVIDTKGPRPHWGSAIAEEVKDLTRLPITMVINTSGAGDHVGGNPELAGSKVEIIAHEHAVTSMRKLRLMFPKPTGGGLPTRTFKDRLTVGSGPDRLELYYFGPAHMDSDIFVVIPALRVLLTGDAFGGKVLSALSRVDKGDGVEYPNTLTRALPLTRDIDMIVTGHGGVARPKDLEIHRDFMRDFLEATRRAKKAGQTATAAARAWKLPARYVGYKVEPARVSGAMEWIYQQLP